MKNEPGNRSWTIIYEQPSNRTIEYSYTIKYIHLIFYNKPHCKCELEQLETTINNNMIIT